MLLLATLYTYLSNFNVLYTYISGIFSCRIPYLIPFSLHFILTLRVFWLNKKYEIYLFTYVLAAAIELWTKRSLRVTARYITVNWKPWKASFYVFILSLVLELLYSRYFIVTVPFLLFSLLILFFYCSVYSIFLSCFLSSSIAYPPLLCSTRCHFFHLPSIQWCHYIYLTILSCSTQIWCWIINNDGVGAIEKMSKRMGEHTRLIVENTKVHI